MEALAKEELDIFVFHPIIWSDLIAAKKTLRYIIMLH